MSFNFGTRESGPGTGVIHQILEPETRNFMGRPKKKKTEEIDGTIGRFGSFPIYTRTITAYTNWTLDLETLFEKLPITYYHELPKKRGRKKLNEFHEDPNANIPYGSLITLKCKKKGEHYRLRGVNLKGSDCFCNSITVVIVLDKHINFKLYRNGTFHITGCKEIRHASEVIRYTWDYVQAIAKESSEVFSLPSGEYPIAYSEIVMNNICFPLGFKLNRTQTKDVFNHETQDEYLAVFDPNAEHAGVQIRRPIDNFEEYHQVHRMRLLKSGWECLDRPFNEMIEFLKSHDPAKANKLAHGEKSHTFMAFHGGKVIQSCPVYELMEEAFDHFVTVCQGLRSQIEDSVED